MNVELELQTLLETALKEKEAETKLLEAEKRKTMELQSHISRLNITCDFLNNVNAQRLNNGNVLDCRSATSDYKLGLYDMQITDHSM